MGLRNPFIFAASGTAPLSYQWQRNQVDITGANSAGYTLSSAQLTDNGALFRCVVTNAYGSATSNDATLTVTPNNPPTGSITQPNNGTYYNAGDTINYAGTGADPEDGTLAASAFTWQVDFHHADRIHPFISPTSGSKSGSFVIPTSGETDANQWYRIYLTVSDLGGLQHTSYVEIFPRKSTITLASNPSGLQVKLDDQLQTTPYSFVGVVGMTRKLEAVSPQTVSGTTWQFTSWSDGGVILHNISTPASNTIYTAAYNSGVATGNGLTGAYYNNKDFTGTLVTRIDPTVNFDWGKGSPTAAIDPDTFSVRWTGQVQPQFSETYTFYTLTNDGVRLWVNGQIIIDRWVNNPSGEGSGAITLTGGQKYSIRMDYYENRGTASAKLSWSSQSQAKQIVPMNRLYSQ